MTFSPTNQFSKSTLFPTSSGSHVPFDDDNLDDFVDTDAPTFYTYVYGDLSPEQYHFYSSLLLFVRNILVLITFISTGSFIYFCYAMRHVNPPRNFIQPFPTSQDEPDDGITESQYLELRRRALPIILNCNTYSESFVNNSQNETKEGSSKVEQNFSSYFKRLSDDENDEPNFECTICLEPYINGEEISAAESCSHIFHKDCILEWLLKSDLCPCCRTQMIDPIKIKHLIETFSDDGNV